MNHQQIRAFFELNQTRPKKQLGQNFLVNPEVLKIILEAGALTARDTVIEIGAGLGCLTEVLAQHAERVIAVEVDELLYNALASHFGVTCGFPKLALQKSTDSSVQLLNADILKLELNSLLVDGNPGTGFPTTFKVIANLPYSITTPILRKLLAHHQQIHSCVLMMAERGSRKNCCGPRGEGLRRVDNRGRLLRRGNAYCHAAARKFYPAPKVDSALLKLTMRDIPKVAVDNEELFFKVVRTAFRTRRKMLKNALVRGKFVSAEVLAAAFEELGIAPQRRAETLDITEFAALANFLSQPKLTQN